MRDIKSLKPTVEWSSCFCSGGKATSFEGLIKVPSSYEAPEKRSFDLYVQKHTKTTRAQDITLHIIFLNGGPGQHIWEFNGIMSGLLSRYPNAALYSNDHRGLGRSGSFIDANISFRDFEAKIPSIVSSAPFDAKDLTLENAAMDIGMIVEAIRSSKDFNSSSKFAILGGSYGALLGSQVVAKLKDMFDYAFLFSMPTLPHLRPLRQADRGLAEACDNDEFCRQHVGSNPKTVIRDALKTITTAPLNQCTMDYFSTTVYDEKVKKGVSQGRMTRYLSITLSSLLLNRAKVPGQEKDLLQPQLALAFIMSMAQCKDPASFREKVLNPIKPYLISQTSHSSGKLSGMNAFVNAMILLDYGYDYKTHYKTPASFEGLDPSTIIFTKMYYARYQKLKEYLNPKKTETGVIKAPKLKLLVHNGMMDLNTPYYPAYRLFDDSITNGSIWAMSSTAGHDALNHGCAIALISAVIDGKVRQAEKCLKRADEIHKLDWSFSKYPRFKSLWAVNTLEKVPEKSVARTIPNFQLKGSIVYDTNYDLYLLIGGGVLCVLLVVGVLLHRRRRRPA